MVSTGKARSTALRLAYRTICVAASIAAIGAANHLLREGGIRALMVGVATWIALLALITGLAGIALGFAEPRKASTLLGIVGVVLLGAGVVGVHAGARFIGRVAPIEPVALSVGALLMLLCLAPVALFYVKAAAFLFSDRLRL